MKLTAVVQKVDEGYVAFVEELLGANTQAATLTEARANLQRAATLVLEANRLLAEETLLGTDVTRETFELVARPKVIWTSRAYAPLKPTTLDTPL